MEKDPDAGRDWGQEEKGTMEIEWLDGITNLIDMSLGNVRVGVTGLISLQSKGL